MATLAYYDECVVDLPKGWINADQLEQALSRCGNALVGPFRVVVVRIAAGCKLMLHVMIQLLSFCNQVLFQSKGLRLEFLSGSERTLTYLARMRFFEFLRPDAVVLPTRPRGAQAVGRNQGLVEIHRFSGRVSPDRDLPNKFALAVERGCSGRADGKQAADAVATIISELTHNVTEHSGTPLDAFAALQTYPNGNLVTLAVSDSGKGIMGTLRPALAARGDLAAGMGNIDLLIEIFRRGLSSSPDVNRGMGLMTSARSAIRYGAELDVRLPNQRVRLKPAGNAYRANTALTREGLMLLSGTHIAFSLKLG